MDLEHNEKLIDIVNTLYDLVTAATPQADAEEFANKMKVFIRSEVEAAVVDILKEIRDEVLSHNDQMRDVISEEYAKIRTDISECEHQIAKLTRDLNRMQTKIDQIFTVSTTSDTTNVPF